ncbi:MULTISPECIES: adenylate/guanylate cyclase domain-containing protein [unclassified Bradyrhizobium]|uniref:adenylate/guanylate cyclase domain-containing protein n=1 Tax=unclassified Bradyrhizobium TaxID=2631580 RepID=UPI001BAD90CC|nr:MULTISPECIES: adenylate/guanylate cyclase domain-containing protein [unclassified Bradyrhizobium]MBR1229992.1 tetratricopeptide repeat protein [Bradyrhizobium sp. AUGA SZCCT0176]MBR1297760.1 tetratricopeptide repeat protein [Bradyrhizobium sp. AUGA SZCCT0042]
MGIDLVAARQKRRLMAVMLADVVSYSRMMSRSEDETHARFSTYVSELIAPTVKKHGGRLVRSMGDGLLVEFWSAVDAVRCALDIQRGLAERQSGDAEKMQLRIGINTGDVLVDHRDIYGNSVNIAARLEALALPGTVCVSQSIYDQTRAQPEFFFAYRGARNVKNIPYPIHAYQVAYERIHETFATLLVANWVKLIATISIVALAVASVASFLVFREQNQAAGRTNTIVVLPFKNVDGNTADEYLADAITDDLTTELSRLRRAWVIASGTAFAYKGKSTDPRQIGRELKVRYALEGSVRRAGPMVQVNAQLIDTRSGTNLWANRFERETGSLLDLQDSMLLRIAASLNDEMVQQGVRHEVGTLAADGNPLDERMKAMAANTGYPTPQKSLETRQHAEAGLKADPDNARLWGLLANVLSSDVLNSWNGAGKPEVDRAEDAANRAIKLDPNTTLAHYALGFVNRLRGNHKASLDSFNEAIRLNPNLAKAYAQAANEMVFVGKPAEAIPLSEQAAQLSPKDPSFGVFRWVKGRAYFVVGDYARAIEALEESVNVRPNLWFSQAWLIAAYALTNRDADAKKALETFRKTSFSKQKYDLNKITEYYKDDQYQTETLLEATASLLEGLRKAGLK